MKPILALSTSWCSKRHLDGYAMIQEMAALGFGHVELSHGIRISLVPGILRGVEEGIVKVSSTHNFCPLPAGVTDAAPNLFQPSAGDAREHAQWVRQTKRSIDFAAEVGAKALVCHLGSVWFLWFSPGNPIRSYLAAHPETVPAEDKRYQAILGKSLVRLRKHMGPYWQRTQDTLRTVLGYAAEKKIVLGLENREKFEELPLDADFADYVGGLPPEAPAGYWHDTGHAQLKEDMGLLNHREHLRKNADRLLGFHLHDVKESEDHQPVGSGKIDFKMVSEFWNPEHLLTLEFGPRIDKEGVLASKARIEELLSIRFGVGR